MRIGEYAPGGTVNVPDAQKKNTAPSAGPLGTSLPDSSPTEAETLLRLGIGKPTVARAVELARRNATTIEQELIANGWVEAESYYAAIAHDLRLPYVAALDATQIPDTDILDTQLIQPRSVRLNYLKQGVVAIVPEARKLDGLKQMFAEKPELPERLVVTTPAAMREAVWETGARRRVRDCINRLFDNQRQMSARIVFSGNQGFFFGILLTLLVLSLLFVDGALIVLHVALSLAYFIVLMMRIVAVRLRKRPEPPVVTAAPSTPLPVYSVLVPLYREAALAPQLVAMLRRLNWPSSLLDIKFLCEADDHETIAALKAQGLEPHFEVVAVPASLPRTKPKALTYALSGARGEYLAIYDAEDRPHPDQLREAYAAFQAGPAELACVQAPLVIANAAESWISAIFSLEYSALFRAFLPMLARYRLPLPLGGTSNHFKTAVLRECDAWDPFNVTEDADLGMRLYRLGYRSSVITRHTLEDAPETLPVWMRQRTRWFKGWLQTWLVMMRNPLALMRQMGLRGFLVFQLLIGGMLLSSLAHPLMLAFVVQWIVSLAVAGEDGLDPFQLVLFWIDGANILLSYAVFLVMGLSVMSDYEKRQLRGRRIMVPVYWLMVSYGAWKAVWQLRTNPFFWDKTPHKPAKLAPWLHFSRNPNG